MTDQWISPVDRARMGRNNDLLTRLDTLETQSKATAGINVQSSDLGDFSEDMGVLRSGSIYWGTGDPYDLTTSPVGVLAEALGIHVYNNTEVGRFGDLNGFLSYVTDIDGIALGDPTAYLTYDQTNGLRIKGTISVVGNFPTLFDVWDETILGVDGVSLIFNAANPIITGTLHIVINGVWLFAEVGPDSDYETSPGNRISMAQAPAATDVLSANYTKTADRTLVYNETPATVGGFPTLFDLLNNFNSGSLELVINGVSQDKVLDYHGGSNGFGFLNAPTLGDSVRASYLVIPNAKFVGMEKLTSQITGVATVFTFANNYASGTPLLVLNGIKQTITNDYTESGANQITMTKAPVVGDHFWVTYLKP